jgi:hypothetical protein
VFGSTAKSSTGFLALFDAAISPVSTFFSALIAATFLTRSLISFLFLTLVL